jgi:ABC-type multidrug transport system fused ATPase/permease subunit
MMWISCIVAKDGFEGYYLFDQKELDLVLMCVFAVIVILIIVFYYPTVVFQFVLDTSIQMMKRRDYIELVIKEQKHQKALRSMRMYQVFKLIRRELIDYFNVNTEDKPLRIFNNRLLDENVAICQHGKHDLISTEELNEFYPLCGMKLKKLESYMLLKKAKSEGDEVTFADLHEAIKQTTNDVKADPYEVMTTIFLLLLKEKEKLSIEDIKAFFDEYDGYFEKEDVEEFMDEMLSIQRKGGIVDIQEIASLIRDDIE